MKNNRRNGLDGYFRQKKVVVMHYHWRRNVVMKFVVLLIATFSLSLGVHEKVTANPSKEQKQKSAITTINVVDAIREGKIEVKVVGAGLTEVQVKIKRLSQEKFRVSIPPGTFFVNRGEAQNMVSTKSVNFIFIKDRNAVLSVPASCANAHKKVPDKNSTFDIVRTPRSQELKKLTKKFAQTNSLTNVVKQVAVWVVTDNVSREYLDKRYVKRKPFGCYSLLETRGDSIVSVEHCHPAASDEDIVSALLLIDQAGIDVSQKALLTEAIKIKTLGSKDISTQKFGAKVLEINVTDRIDYLISKLVDDDIRIRTLAAENLAYKGNNDAIEPLLRMLDDQEEKVRISAITALGTIQDPQATKPLLRMLKDQVKWVRISAITALGTIQDPQATKPLLRMLDDQEEKVQISAMEALGTIQDPQATKLLITMLGDQEEEVRINAIKALEIIRDPMTVSLLAKMLTDKEEKVRVIGINALGSIRDPKAISPLISYIKNVSSVSKVEGAAIKQALANLENLWGVDISPDLGH